MSASEQSQPVYEPLGIDKPLFSLECEQSVLGGLMIDPDRWDEVSQEISESDFFRLDHRLIFGAITELSLADGSTDMFSVLELLERKRKDEEAGGHSYVCMLACNVPTSANIVHYAKQVKAYSIRRQIIHDATHLIEDARKEPDIDKVLNKSQGAFTNISLNEKSGGPKRVSEMLTNVLGNLDDRFNNQDQVIGLPTGFKDLDDTTAGLHPGDLIIVAGRPSMGKTTFAMNIAEQAATKQSKAVLIFSMEMDSEQLINRSMASLGGVNAQNMRTGKVHDDEWPRITEATQMLSESDLIIDESGGLSVHELSARARQTNKQTRLGLIVVDYIQLMEGKGENRNMEISEVSRLLKKLAKELGIPVIALSQLNRELERRPDKRPKMSDLRDSGAIEQDADVIIFMYRDEVYNETSDNQGKAEAIIAKQRSGPLKTIHLSFQGHFNRFKDCIDIPHDQWSLIPQAQGGGLN